jgi:hypothetical protein
LGRCVEGKKLGLWNHEDNFVVAFEGGGLDEVAGLSGRSRIFELNCLEIGKFDTLFRRDNDRADPSAPSSSAPIRFKA